MTDNILDMLKHHFDTAFAAPNGIEKLRELILTLAMRGKLVSQNPEDQSASELLKEIETEKQRLVKEGIIKKPKVLPTLNRENVPYTLPKGWVWVRIGTIGNVFNGNSINAREKETKYAGAEGLPYIATKDVSYGLEVLDYANGIYIPETEEKFKVAHQGSILICAEGGSAGKKCGITDRDICFGNKLFANEPFGGIPPRFILYLYLSPVFKSLFIKAITGIIGGVSIAKFMELMIPLPPLPEQYRIVAKIDQLMAHCDELEKLRIEREQKRLSAHTATIKQLLDAEQYTNAWQFITQHFGELYSVKENITELRKAILQLAVMGRLVPQNSSDPPASELLKKIKAEKQQLVKEGKIKKPKPLPEIKVKEVPYTLPKGWEWVRLEQILVFGPTNGFSPKAVDYKTSVRSLTLSATTSGIFKGEHSKFIANQIPKDSNLWLEDGDILVQRGNTLEYVGVPAVYCGPAKQFIYPDLMMKLRVASVIFNDYAHRAMSVETSRDYLRAHASGTSSTMPKISQTTLKSLPFPLPPLAEQHRIVVKIDQLMALCDTLEQKIDAADNKQTALLNSMMTQV